jgi:GGDEF domain-containing protein
VARVGDVCRRFGRASDAYGRLGPREFAVVPPATNGDGARRLVERIQDVLDSLSAVDSDASPVRLHAEFCVVDDYADSQVDAVEMLMRAAAALRDHRHAGQTERREAGHAPGVTGLSLTTPLA